MIPSPEYRQKPSHHADRREDAHALEAGRDQRRHRAARKGAQAPIFAISVASVDDYVQKVEQGGGNVVKPKADVMGMGYYAYVGYTEGNVIGTWEDAKK